jgi:hypothetical protein
MVSPSRQTVNEWRRLFDKGKPHTGKRNKKSNKNKNKNKIHINRNNNKPQTIQQDLHGRSSLPSWEPFGDTIKKSKISSTVRIGFQNINILTKNKNTTKSKNMLEFMYKNEFDLWLMSEVGLNWHKVDPQDLWFERIREKFGDQSTRSYMAFNSNEQEIAEPLQYGGTGIFANTEVAHRVISSGQDPEKLGRWTWMLLQGKRGIRIRVVSAYRPSNSNNGTDSVMIQHYRHFKENNRVDDNGVTVNPRSAFYEDLGKEIKKWSEEGDQIIVGIDANEDVREGQTKEFFNKLNMYESILSNHSDLNPQSTNSKSLSSRPIDGIFVSLSLTASASGYMAFGDGCQSDHRVLWIELSYEQAFGYISPPLMSAPPRRLTCAVPSRVESYNLQVKSALKKAGLIKRLDKIFLAAKDTWTPALQLGYDAIHNSQNIIRKLIESKLRKLRSGGKPWSPQLQEYRDKILLWSLIFKRKSGQKIATSIIKRAMKKTEYRDLQSITLLEATNQKNRSYAEYKIAKKNAEIWRDDFLVMLAKQRSERDKSTTEDIELKKLNTINLQQKIGRNVKRMRGKLERNATTKVSHWVDGVKVDCINKTDIEEACMAENISRFSQSESTPVMTEPLVSLLGYLADGPSVDNILNGCFTPPSNCDPHAVKLLQHLSIPDKVRSSTPASTTISVQDHINLWKKQKEFTTADPQGLTFSHYKAAIQDATLAEFDSKLRSLPYQHGFVPELWKSITDVEILKKAQVYDLNKMRTITIMNAEFNANNKKLGRDTMRKAEECNSLPREQYGCRKNHKSSHALLNKRLTCDLFRLRRHSAAICGNDLKSCFDRLLHSIIIISMICQGAPVNATRGMCATLQQALHYISTAFGRSDEHYGGDRIPPLQGSGQGNGCGPTSCVATFAPVVEMMRTEGFGINVLSALSKTLVNFVCYSFVDDTDLGHSTPSVNTSGETIMAEMQKALDLWEGGIRATGGAIVPEKSYWCLIDFVWNGSKWDYRHIHDCPGEIYIKSITDDSRIKLERCEPEAAKETLGGFLAIDGNNKEQIIHLTKKAQEFADCIRVGKITKAEAWYGFTSSIMRTMAYPMDAINLTKKEWDKIMSILLCSTLPKAGINRNFPRKVVYTPPEFLGLGIVHPWYSQQLGHIQIIMEECSTQSITGDLIKANLEQLRLEMGLPGYLVDSWSAIEPAITDCWAKSLCSFMFKNRLELLDPLPKLQPLRENDKFIIKEAIQLGYRNLDLKRINECRMFLSSTCMSELCTADGYKIRDSIWNGQKDYSIRDFGWPRRQDSLSAQHWNVWKKFITKWCSNASLKVSHPFGPWIKKEISSWQWRYCEIESRLYKKEGHLWRAYRKTNRRISRLSSSSFEQTEFTYPLCPPSSVLASVFFRPSSVGISSTAPFPLEIIPENTITSTNSIIQILASLPPEDKWAVGKLIQNDNSSSIAAAIINRSAYAVSDGSFKHNRGTSASILTGSNPKIRIMSVNNVPGNPDEQSAYRSELAGISGSISLIKAVCEKHDVTSGRITIGLDGERAMIAVSTSESPMAKSPDFDLITDIRGKIASLKIDINWKWIKGHQDKNTSVTNLDFLGKLNVKCDTLAKRYWKKVHSSPPNQKLADEPWSLCWNGTKLSRVDTKKLYSKMSEASSMALWSRYIGKSEEIIKTSDWDVSGSAFKQLRFSKQRRLAKNTTGQCAIGKVMLQRDKWKHDHCPRCDLPELHTDHISTCQDPSASAQWKLSLAALKQWMADNKSMPEIQSAIILGLDKWRSSSCIDPHITFSVHRAVRHQTKLGWNNLLKGFISPKWAQRQSDYYKKIGSKRSGRTWAIALLKKLWGVSWDMWEHRNGVLHGTELTASERRESIALRADIAAERSKGTVGLDPFAIGLSNISDVVVQKWRIPQQKKWLKTMKIARQPSVNSVITRQRTTLRLWLQGDQP